VGATPDPGLGPVVLVASDPLGYRATSERVRAWVAAGCDVVGVLLAGDEAVLVSRRVGIDVPVLDQVDPAVALAARVVALEVGEPGRPARRLTDPVHLAAVLGLGQHEHPHAEALARSVRGLGDVAVAVLDSEPARGAAAPEGWFDDAEGRRHDIVRTLAAQDHRLLSSARSVGVPDATGAVVPRPVDDLWAVDLATLTRDAVLRANAVQPHAVALATLAEVAGDEIHEQVRAMAAATGRPVVAVAAESDAARAGALTTPGASPHATVVDIGGGTVDVVSPDGTARVLAGAGDLVTAATSTLLGLARGPAEWVKRGPCARGAGPPLRLDFLDTPAASGSVGWLVVPGPAGPLPFDRRLAPPEWRTLRLRLKSAVLGDNVARGGVGPVGGDVIVVGGPAGDDEVLDCVARVLPGSVPGRGDVAGALGHRWAVAYGLVVLAAAGAT
jgi:hypothetical protein